MTNPQAYDIIGVQKQKGIDKMRKDRYIKVVLTDEEKDTLLKSAEIIDELADVMGNVISADGYDDIDLEDLRDVTRAIAYERIFEISE